MKQRQRATYPASDLGHWKWQELRERLISQRGNKCQKCGVDSPDIHVHHITYIEGRRAWEYKDTEFQILCDTCHGREHGYTKRCAYQGCNTLIRDHFRYCVHHLKEVKLDDKWAKIEAERSEVEADRSSLEEEKEKVVSERDNLEQEKLEIENLRIAAQEEVKRIRRDEKKYTDKAKKAKEEHDRQVAKLQAIERALEEKQRETEKLERQIEQKVKAENELERRLKIKEGEDKARVIEAEALAKASEIGFKAASKAKEIENAALEKEKVATRKADETLVDAKVQADALVKNGEVIGSKSIEAAKVYSRRLIVRAGIGVLTLAFALFFYVLATIGVKRLADSINKAESLESNRYDFSQDLGRVGTSSDRSTSATQIKLPPAVEIRAEQGEQLTPSLPSIPKDSVSGHLECPRKECEGTMRLEDFGGTLRYACSNSPACKMKIDYPFKCYRCGAEMVLRDGKNGKFWGCSTFPKCRHTNDYK